MQLSRLKERLELQHPTVIVACHNDLQYGNIMISKSEHRSAHNSSLPDIRLIDYEYSGFNPLALDIANHW